jgi:Flp pilus assembly protein TadD
MEFINGETLEATVRQLEEAGNWNVLVLHASKWTREQPENPAAWSALGTGYANLRQFDDALVAAARAAQLAPGDPRLWRNLGQLNLTLGNLPEAGNAFDRALAVSSDDAAALCGAALVAQRQGRPKDADAMARRLRPDAGICPGVSDGETVTVDAGSHAKRKPVPPAGR